jgi:hypothetical protein
MYECVDDCAQGSMNEQLFKDLLDSIKNRYSYPPAKPVDAFFASPSRPRSLSQGDIPSFTGRYCAIQIESIMTELTDHLLNNLGSLGLTSDEEIQATLNRALQSLFTEARGVLSKQLGDRKEQAMTALDVTFDTISDEIQRKVRLRHLDLGGQRMPQINITDSQNINVVIGSLNTSIRQIIERGGPEEKAGQILQDFLQLVSKLETGVKEQSDLLNLTRGLLREIQLPKEERNQSTMRAILERVQLVGSTISGAAEIAQFVKENIPLLLGLLGLG